MNNIIIGTAGHVDHGKTTLIKALTGVDTDRLKEEKERGITIELGFAYLTLPDGQRCGIIDVPGHERFVRNMLAGAGSVDLALFVVAGDEGIMPQSREHLEILQLLDIKRGIIAVTKSDIVEAEWLEMVVADIRGEVKDTFLESAEIIPVSARTGEGIEKLKQSLFNMILADRADKRDTAPSRLPVDRVFSKDGFGTVVTGTLTDGEISVGGELTLFPAMIQAKVRNLQVHSQSVSIAKRGQRVAINLAGIKTEDIQKGCALAAQNSMRNTDILDVRLDIVKSTKRRVENNSRLHLYLGTSDVTCKLILLGKDALTAGQSCYAQLRTEEPVAARLGDRFVVRFYSPMETVGGGVILDPNPAKRSRADASALEFFKTKEKGNLREKIACFILDKSKTFPLLKELKINPFLNDAKFDEEINNLTAKKEIFLIKDSVIHRNYADVLIKKCKTILKDFHAKNPLLEGIKKEELRSKLLIKTQQQYFDALISVMENERAININGNTVSFADFEILLSETQKKMTSEITQILLGAGFSTPSLDELAQKYPKEQKTFKNAVDALVSQGIIILLTPQIVVHREYFDNAIKAASAFKREFTLAEFRDSIETSRKYAVALLEYFDDKGITKKQGEGRVVR